MPTPLNFNGIDLLDGTMSVTGGATEMVVEGINSTKSAGAAGAYVNNVAIADETVTAGDTISFTIGLNNGQPYTAKVTVGASQDGANANGGLYDADGNWIADLAADGTAAADELESAFIAQFQQTDLAKDFTITGGGDGTITLTNLRNGAGEPQVGAMDYTAVISGAPGTVTDMGVDATLGVDDGREIASTDITEYDGTNYEDAVFTINGKKFVLMTETMDGAAGGFMNATAGLASGPPFCAVSTCTPPKDLQGPKPTGPGRTPHQRCPSL